MEFVDGLLSAYIAGKLRNMSVDTARHITSFLAINRLERMKEIINDTITYAETLSIEHKESADEIARIDEFIILATCACGGCVELRTKTIYVEADPEDRLRLYIENLDD